LKAYAFFIIGVKPVTQTYKLSSLIPVMAAVVVRQKVVSIGHFLPSFCLESLQFFLFVRFVLIALIITAMLSCMLKSKHQFIHPIKDPRKRVS